MAKNQMQCPTCKAGDLAPVQLEEGLIGAGCESCKGVLLSLINYRYWLDKCDTAKRSVNTDELAQSAAVCVDSAVAKICPKCSKLMTKFRIGLETENRIELCAHCDEAWLDEREWKLLKALDLQEKLPQVFTYAWQKKYAKNGNWPARFSKS
jgi:Zn-finger nucleic acid-binding protein